MESMLRISASPSGLIRAQVAASVGGAEQSSGRAGHEQARLRRCDRERPDSLPRDSRKHFEGGPSVGAPRDSAARATHLPVADVHDALRIDHEVVQAHPAQGKAGAGGAPAATAVIRPVEDAVRPCPGRRPADRADRPRATLRRRRAGRPGSRAGLPDGPGNDRNANTNARKTRPAVRCREKSMANPAVLGPEQDGLDLDRGHRLPGRDRDSDGQADLERDRSRCCRCRSRRLLVSFRRCTG